jgi:mono/diheme cytochrome c family protein
MKQSTTKIILFGSLLGAASLLIMCAQGTKEAAMTKEQMVKRGEYLVNAGSCNDCHSPKKFGPKGPEPDPSILLSGHPANLPAPEIPAGLPNPMGWMAMCNAHMTAWAGPWGVSFAANLTPDKQTGIGDWDEEDFIKTLRTGQHLGMGREILPPMPWPNIGTLSDEDLKAIFAYLQSLPAVPNLVPGPIPPMAAAPADSSSHK